MHEVLDSVPRTRVGWEFWAHMGSILAITKIESKNVCEKKTESERERKYELKAQEKTDL